MVLSPLKAKYRSLPGTGYKITEISERKMRTEDRNYLYHGRDWTRKGKRNYIFLITNNACIYENSTYLGM